MKPGPPNSHDRLAAEIRSVLASHSRVAIDRAALPMAPSLRDAAVLLPIIAREGGYSILFVRRTDSVPTHKGQIAFPGGGFDVGESAEECALREAYEEVGLSPHSVEILGRMDDWITISSFIVTPVVGLIRNPPLRFVSQESEVDAIIEVPLERLQNPAHRRTERWSWDRLPPDAPADLIRAARVPRLGWGATDQDYPMFFFETEGGTVWGATAAILEQFLLLTTRAQAGSVK